MAINDGDSTECITMIKTIIFDLDGVLIESKEIHYKALNAALPFDYRIGYEEHLSTYDGLPTKEKLKLVSKEVLHIQA